MLPNSSNLDLSPATNPDAQEALSRLYSNCCVLVLPLKSGKFAIIDRSYQLYTILDSPPDADALRGFSLAFSASKTPPITVPSQIFRKTGDLKPNNSSNLKLDLDLGL